MLEREVRSDFVVPGVSPVPEPTLPGLSCGGGDIRGICRAIFPAPGRNRLLGPILRDEVSTRSRVSEFARYQFLGSTVLSVVVPALTVDFGIKDIPRSYSPDLISTCSLKNLAVELNLRHDPPGRPGNSAARRLEAIVGILYRKSGLAQVSEQFREVFRESIENLPKAFIKNEIPDWDIRGISKLNDEALKCIEGVLGYKFNSPKLVDYALGIGALPCSTSYTDSLLASPLGRLLNRVGINASRLYAAEAIFVNGNGNGTRYLSLGTMALEKSARIPDDIVKRIREVVVSDLAGRFRTSGDPMLIGNALMGGMVVDGGWDSHLRSFKKFPFESLE